MCMNVDHHYIALSLHAHYVVFLFRAKKSPGMKTVSSAIAYNLFTFFVS